MKGGGYQKLKCQNKKEKSELGKIKPETRKNLGNF